MKRKNVLKLLYVLFTAMLGIIVFACIYIDKVTVKQKLADGSEVSWVKAGEVATFTVEGNIDGAEDRTGEHFVIAMLAPKSWNIRQNAILTYRCNVLSSWENTYTMTAIPESEQPKNQPGLSWSKALMGRYGVGPNVLNDMEWVAFKTDDLWDFKNGMKPKYEITVKCKTGMQNLRVKLGFFVNIMSDGLGHDDRYYKCVFSDDCFEVVEGNGGVIDFCQLHSSTVEPLAALQDDFVTFTFQGGVNSNKLVDEEEIFMEAIAHTEAGKTYPVTERSGKTLMRKDGTFGYTYSLTIWPVDFFGIPEGETIVQIDYLFTNRDGSVTITESDDQAAGTGHPAQEPKVPFAFYPGCN